MNSRNEYKGENFMFMRMDSLIRIGLFVAVLFIFYSFKLHAVPSSTVKAYNKAGAIVGTLKADAKCSNGQNEIWISQGRSLYYQAEVPVNGTFEFHVVPGKYNVVVTGSTGCFVEAETFVKEGSVQKLALNLKPAAKTSMNHNTSGVAHE